MHLELDKELPSYKQEAIQAVKETKYQIIASLGLLHSSLRASLGQKRYRKIERETLGILYGLEKFHHYCFAREVSIIMDYKPLIAILKKDITTLSQRHQ